MNKDDLLCVGIITSAHGIRGEVNVFPTTDDIGRFKKLKDVILDTKKGLVPAKLTGAKFFKQTAILKLEGVDDRDAAQELKKVSILVTRENAVKLKKDEYFIADLIGVKVYTKEDALVGVVSDVLVTGANDVYEITIDNSFVCDGVDNMPEKFYAPAIKECIKDVNIEENRIVMDIMPGLI